MASAAHLASSRRMKNRLGQIPHSWTIDGNSRPNFQFVPLLVTIIIRNFIEDLGRGRRAEFRSQPAVLMECRPSDYNGRSCKDGSGGVGHIPRPASEMLIPDANRERNGKKKEDGTT